MKYLRCDIYAVALKVSRFRQDFGFDQTIYRHLRRAGRYIQLLNHILHECYRRWNEISMNLISRILTLHVTILGFR